ncbi:hypothetical protein QBC40DRAFT_213946 [Triangularia verruculosa]|uniref:Uncharacterized protein n=1 Tax=Triangularia verruculosa TaxID=2587418 RepID=A0AAN6X5X3_9PEZI|nr:hypothetical protein QBC40DRAFT_213946 [Triangularia verruculosa]
MRLLPLLLGGVAYYSSLASGNALLGKKYKGPEIWGSYNEIEDCEMNQAIECLHDQICSHRTVPLHGKIRCTIGTSVAYLCNYRGFFDKIEDEYDDIFHHGGNAKGKAKGKAKSKAKKKRGELVCDQSEMYEAWRQIRIAKGSQTGWWYDAAGKKTYGFDKRCKDRECDNGWMRDSEGEQCTNIKKKNNEWVFDFEASTYLNYTGRFEQDLPEPGDDDEPVYFNPWQEGKRPR